MESFVHLGAPALCVGEADVVQQLSAQASPQTRPQTQAAITRKARRAQRRFARGSEASFFAGSSSGSLRHALTSPAPVAARRDLEIRAEAEGLDYASSGVDIDLEAAAVKSLITSLGKAAVRKSGERGALVPHPGGFSGLIEFGPDSLLGLCTDGVGSKLSIANELRYWDTVGIDCMAMNVNDLLCVGCEPLAFVDYVAIPKPDPEVHAALGRSLAEACRQARVSLCGGETASLPGIVTELDLSGTALGWVARGAQLTGERVAPGDLLVGLPSSGIHSNGYSLARKVVEVAGADLRAPAPFDAAWPFRTINRFREGPVTLGEVLLNPTRIYCDPIVDLLKACRDGSGPAPYESLHAMAHITGGGLSNLLRLHPSHGYVIEEPLSVPPEFAWMAERGGVSNREMHRTFNMGLGFVIVVKAEHAKAVSDWLAARLPGTQIVGRVAEGHKVTYAPDPSVVFDHY
eukprot:tig00020961_g16656.t1